MNSEDKSSPRRRRKTRISSSRREQIIEEQLKKIEQLESKYSKLYEGSPVMLRTINTDGLILDCNSAYVRGLGYSSKSEVVGHSIFEHTPDEGIALKRESFEGWRRGGEVKSKEVWLKRKDGSRFPALLNANNLYDDDGQLVGSNTAITDLTDVYKTKRQQEKATEEIRKANAMKTEFIRIAAHELRTPLQPILLVAELAKSNQAGQDEAMDVVLREAKKLRRLANNIIDVSRIESGDFLCIKQKVYLNEIFSEIEDYARNQIEVEHKSEDLKVSTRISNDDIEMLLDPKRLVQALEHVLDNSIKFTQKGQITIESHTLPPKKLLEIKISDTGTAIPEDLLPKLFEKFGTKTSGEHADKHGVGLGLFISREIIQAHGGDIIGYNNEGGQGATFIIRLPIGTKT